MSTPTDRPARVAVAREAGVLRVRTVSALLRPQVTSTGGDRASVSLVATGATLLGGDHVGLEIVVGGGLRLDLSDVAGTVAYDGRGTRCSWTTTITLAPSATLVWHGEPLVVATGAALDRTTIVTMADDARLLMRDTLSLGRTGETGGELRCRTRMSLGGKPVLAEDLHLDAGARTWPGVLGTAKVVDTVTALGWQPPPLPAVTSDLGVVRGTPSGRPRTFDLPCAGMMARALAENAHDSDIPGLWEQWNRTV